MDAEPVSPEITSVACEILRYLRQNLEARDTSEGIRNWWLHTGGEQWSAMEVDHAIALLERYGLLTGYGSEPGFRIYGLSSLGVTCIDRFLNEHCHHKDTEEMKWQQSQSR